MSPSNRIARGFVTSVLVLALSIIAVADTIRLKDGSLIKGKIVSFGSGKFVIAMGEGARRRQLTFAAAEVESIQFDAPDAELAKTTNRNAAYKDPIDKPVEPAPTKVVKNTDTRTTPTTQANTGGEKMKPIEWRIKVLADNTANGWTNTGWVVKKGQRIRIEGDGKVSLGKGNSSPASGIASLGDEQKLLKNVATGALIAVIGDDNNDFIYVGAEREFTATRDGALFLGINEGYLEDNSGSYSVKIEIIPNDGK